MRNIYFIAGHHGVGKTYLVNELKEEIDLIHFDTGPMIRMMYENSNSKISFKNWILVGEKKYGIDFTNKILCKKIEETLNEQNKSNIIITGNRSLEGILYLSKYFLVAFPSIIYLEAPFSLLKANYEARERKTLSDLEFENKLLEEDKSGLYNIKAYVFEHPDTCLFADKINNDDKTIRQVKRKILTKGEKL